MTANQQQKPPPPRAPFEAWGPEQVAEFLGISVRHLSDVRASDGTFPTPRMLGSLPRWSPTVIADWLAGDQPGARPAAPARRAPRDGAGHVR